MIDPKVYSFMQMPFQIHEYFIVGLRYLLCSYIMNYKSDLCLEKVSLCRLLPHLRLPVGGSEK